jgi:hypothetical protein
MPHSHYVLDLYYLEDAKPDRRQHEALRLVADNDAAAIAEGKRIDTWKKSRSFQIRAITSSARSGDRIVFASAPVEAGSDSSIIELPGPAVADPAVS